MSAKARKRSRKPTIDQLAERARCNLERGNCRQSLKDAKVCFRKSPSPENRRLLESAYLGRIHELRRQGNRDACREIVDDLLSFGVTQQDVAAAMPDVQLWLGRFAEVAAEPTDGANASLIRESKILDRLIIRPADAAGAPAELRQAAKMVRAALDAVYVADHATAHQLLRDCPRDSAQADWKFFVRGLMAYYERDIERMQQSWSRLDPQRAAARIAAPLQVFVDPKAPGANDPATRLAAGRLERLVGGQALTGRLTEFSEIMQRDDVRISAQQLRSIRSELRKLDPVLDERFVRCIRDRWIGDGRTEDIEWLAKTTQGWRYDPNWNAAKALVRDNSDESLWFESKPYWEKYIADLQAAVSIPVEQRNLAQAIVWRHLGRFLKNEIRLVQDCPCGASHEDDILELLDGAVGYFESAIRCEPTFVKAYLSLAELYELVEKYDEEADTYERMVKVHPDNTDALLRLVEGRLRQNRPLDARDFALRARRAKPLDREVASVLRATHFAAARWYGLQGDFDRGRAEFSAADALGPADGDAVSDLARRAVFERKAGDEARAHAFVTQAQERLQEPTVLWLMLSLEAARIELPRREAELYENRWITALKRKCQSATAGAMCRLVVNHNVMESPFPVRDDFVDRIAAYVKRCSRVRWNAEDLGFVCKFLTMCKKGDLLQKFVQKGLVQHAEIGFFHMLEGTLEMSKGIGGCRFQVARMQLKTAEVKAKNSKHPLDANVVEKTRQLLDRLEHMASASFFVDEYDEYDDEYDDDEYDDDEYDDDEVANEGGGPFDSDRGFTGLTVDMIREMCIRVGLDPKELLRAFRAEKQGPAAGKSGSATPKNRNKRK